uniref:GTP-binding protein n=1 Tax=Geobacter metallireducens TaxID=28232 RepID=A0A831UDH1_GEOME
MALFNRTKREINAKIVYFGAPLAGKATTLQFIHRKLKPECRGPVKTMGGRMDRMLFFDFMPPELGEVNDCRVRFHLYTVQGEVADPSSWKTVLKGADGVVFVADASPESSTATVESFEKLKAFLRSYGQDLERLPCVIQCNKGDLPDSLDPGEMVRLLDSGAIPVVRSVARTGEGLLQVLSTVVKGIMGSLRDREPPGAAEPSPVADLHGIAPIPGAAAAEAGPEESAVSPEKSGVTEETRAADVPTLAMGGGVTVTADGTLRIPLAVRWGGGERGYVLSVALSPEIPARDESGE